MWCGVVWCGVVWCGVLWHGMVGFALMWHYVILIFSYVSLHHHLSLLTLSYSFFFFDFLLLVSSGPREEFQWKWSCTPSHQDVSECRQYWGLNAILDFTLICCILTCFFSKCLEHVEILSVTDFALLTNPRFWFFIFSHSLYFLISLRI